LVEPAPTQFNAIYEHYKDEPRIVTLNVAIGEFTGELDFYESLDAVSTSDVAHMTKWNNAGVPYNKIKVPQIKTKDFFDEYCHGVDFLSVDTEATNMAVFNAIPDFVFNQIKLFCIEHDYKHEEIKDRLREFGFYQLYFNGENIILGK
jgi:FkbM family methyltransferase